MSTKHCGATANAHLTSLYEMPLSPGAEELEEWARVAAISADVIGSNSQGGRGGGSSHSEMGKGRGAPRKKQPARAVSISAGKAETPPSGVWSRVMRKER
jgi:hypothetical protein